LFSFWGGIRHSIKSNIEADQISFGGNNLCKLYKKSVVLTRRFGGATGNPKPARFQNHINTRPLEPRVFFTGIMPMQ
jgi:hypothetical protein